MLLSPDIVLVLVLLLLCCGELLARMALLKRGCLKQIWGQYYLSPHKTLSFLNHPYALYVKKPNCDGIYPSNNLGYAGKKDLRVKKERNVVRIYCAGGSTVEQHVPEEGINTSWPALLQQRLEKRFPDKQIEVINAGVAGYTSAESLAEFAFRGIDLKPDILLMYHGVNDAWACQMVDNFRTDYSHARVSKPWTISKLDRLPQIPFCAFYQILAELIRNKVSHYNALIYWISSPPWRLAQAIMPEAVWAFERNTRNLVTISQSWNCIPVLIKWECDWRAHYIPHLPPYFVGTDTKRIRELYLEYLHANNTALKRISASISGCYYLDAGPFESSYFVDTMHFNFAGLNQMADRLEVFLVPIVEAYFNKLLLDYNE